MENVEESFLNYWNYIILLSYTFSLIGISDVFSWCRIAVIVIVEPFDLINCGVWIWSRQGHLSPSGLWVVESSESNTDLMPSFVFIFWFSECIEPLT